MATAPVIAIEKAVPPPLPEARRKYPWPQMDVGDSVAVPIGNKHPIQAQQAIASSARSFFGRGNSVSRREGEFIRIWRVA